jgi:hypothetical protein
VSELELDWLVGTGVRIVEVDDFARWTFSFVNGGVAKVGSPWRLIVEQVIAISSADHGQKYGLPAVIDAGAVLLKRLHARTVVSVMIRKAPLI